MARIKIGSRAEQGIHSPLQVSAKPGEEKIAMELTQYRAVVCLREGFPVSFSGIPGKLIEGPDNDGLFRFQAPAANIDDWVPPGALCQHFPQIGE